MLVVGLATLLPFRVHGADCIRENIDGSADCKGSHRGSKRAVQCNHHCTFGGLDAARNGSCRNAHRRARNAIICRQRRAGYGESRWGPGNGGRRPDARFRRANASKREKLWFFELAKQARPVAERAQVSGNDWVVIIPAFVVTQLIEAFALGFLIYLPFLVIDLVVSNVLLALGMQMMTPTQVSLPFKLLLFVAIDGSGLISQALVTGYHLS